LLDSLVADDEVKTPLKPYFAVVETVWDSPATSGEATVLRPPAVLP
jgi:hypothetical protein